MRVPYALIKNYVRMKKSLLILCWSLVSAAVLAQQETVNLNVDVTKSQGTLKHIWAWFGV